MNTKTIDLILEDCDAVTKHDANVLANLKNDTILITGGTGFMGTWLSTLLCFLNDAHGFNSQIILVARNIEHFKKTRPHLAQRKDIRLVAEDVRHLVDLPSEANWVIHAAAIPDNRFHASNPLETMSIIADGTKAILNNLQRASNLKMFLNLSSGLIYGGQPSHLEKISENHAGAPKSSSVSSAYAEAKRYAETLCSSARSQTKIPVIIARPFAFIGPYQSLEAPWAINNFMRDAINSNPIRILGDGKTLRSYLYASDMAFWLLKILALGKSGDIYNIGSEQAISLEQLALFIASQISAPIEIKLQTPVFDNTAHFIPDTSYAKNNLQLTATVDLETAIKKTIAWNKLSQSK